MQRKKGCGLHLKKSLYGLKQNSRAWFDKFSKVALEFGLNKSKYDHSIFYRQLAVGLIFLVIYVDDIVIIGDDCAGIFFFKSFLHTKFHTKDLAQLILESRSDRKQERDSLA